MFEDIYFDNITNAILGGVEKWFRVEKGLTLDNVASDLGISKGNLSEIESGKRPLRQEVFDSFCIEYGLELDRSKAVFDQSVELLNSWVFAYLKLDKSKMEQIVQKMQDVSVLLQNSFGCLNYALLQALVSSESATERQLIKQANVKRVLAFGFCFFPDYEALIYLAKALVYIRFGKTKDSIPCLHKALNTIDGSVFRDLEGVLYSHLAKAYSDSESFELGVHYAQKAMDLFYRTGNFYRLNLIKHNLAVYYLYLRCFRISNRLFDEILDYVKMFDNSTFRETSVQNKILLFFLSEDYYQLLEYVKQAEIQSTYHGEIANFGMVPCACYSLDLMDEMDFSISEIKKRKLDREDRLLLSLLESFRTKDKEGAVNIYNTYMKICIKTSNWGMMMALNALMLTFAKKVNSRMLELSLFYQKDQIFNHNFPDRIEADSIREIWS